MSERPHASAARRRAARARVRRRRIVALVALVTASVVAAAGLALARSHHRHATVAAARPHAKTTIGHKARAKARARAKAHHRAARSPTAALVPAAAQAAALDRVLARGLPVFCGGHTGHYVALTFDDGPGAYTHIVLKNLRFAHMRATFFLVGRNLAAWSTLPASELTLAALGDHTWTHAYLPALSDAALTSEVERTKTAIEQLTKQPVRLFRPPYGAHNAAIDALAKQLGMVEVLWSIDTRDSEGATSNQIAANVASGIRPGSIVLMHENRGLTEWALKSQILPMLKRRHLTPVSVPELLALDPPTAAQLRAGEGACFT